MYTHHTTTTNPDVVEIDTDNRPFSFDINKRPNKRSHTRGRIQPNEHTGIRKPTTHTTPANQLKNPTWNRDLRQWVEGNDEIVYEEEPTTPFTATSEIRGYNKDNVQYSRLVSSSKITPWRKHPIERVHSRHSIQSRQPSHFKKRGGTRKRKNKHTRRRIKRRRVRA